METYLVENMYRHQRRAVERQADGTCPSIEHAGRGTPHGTRGTSLQCGPGPRRGNPNDSLKVEGEVHWEIGRLVGEECSCGPEADEAATIGTEIRRQDCAPPLDIFGTAHAKEMAHCIQRNGAHGGDVRVKQRC